MPNPIPVKISKVGTGHAIIIPKALRQYLGWSPGMRVAAVLRKGGQPIDRELILLGNGLSLAILVRQVDLTANGLRPGQKVAVPFHEWRVK